MCDRQGDTAAADARLLGRVRRAREHSSPRRRGATSPGFPSRFTRSRSRRGRARPALSISSTQRRRGTGSIRASATRRHTTCCAPAGTSRSGARYTRAPKASIRSSPRSRRCTTDRREPRRRLAAGAARAGAGLRGRDPAKRTVRGRARAALRLGAPVQRRRVHRVAGDVLRAHLDGRREARAPLPRDSREAWRPAECDATGTRSSTSREARHRSSRRARKVQRMRRRMHVNHERGGMDCGVPRDKARVVGASLALPRVQRSRREVADGPRIAALPRVPGRGRAARPRPLRRGAARAQRCGQTSSRFLTNRQLDRGKLG